MSRRIVWAGALLASVWCVAPAGAAGSRVLFRGGEIARDGVMLFGPREVANRGGQVVFLATQSAVVVQWAGAWQLGWVSRPASGGARVVFAGHGASAGAGGLYLWTEAMRVFDPGTVEQVASGDVLASDVNGYGDVAYATPTSVCLSSGGETTELVRNGTVVPEGEIRFGRTRRRSLALSDDGSVAFVAQVRVTREEGRAGRPAVLAASAGAAPKVVAVDGDPSPAGEPYALGRGSPVSIDSSGRITFAGGGVFRYDPQIATVTPIAHAGQLVGAEALAGFGDFVGSDSQGRVAFKGRFGSGAAAVTRIVRLVNGTLSSLGDGNGTFAPRLTFSGVLRAYLGRVDIVSTFSELPLGGPAIGHPVGFGFLADASSFGFGVSAFVSHRGGVYVVGNEPPEPVLTEGESTADGTLLVSISDFAFDGNRVVALASDGEDGFVLAARTLGGPLVRLARSGDPTPLGGTFDLAEAVPKLGRHGVVFAADVVGGADASRGIFRAAVKGTRVESIVRTGKRVKGGRVLEDVFGPAPLARGVAFQGTLVGEDGGEGLFVARGRRIRTIAVSGDHAPGGGRFVSFGPPVAERSRLLFEAAVDLRTGGRTVSLFVWSPRGGLVRVARAGARIRGGGRIDSLGESDGFGRYAFGRGSIVFTGRFSAGGAATDALFLRRHGHLRRLLSAGTGGSTDPVNIEDFTVAGRDVAVVATVSTDDGPRERILALEP
jgi:hypothetical protein